MSRIGPRKILVVRVGRVGDLVLITPALNLLLAGFPQAEVHLLTSREGRRVLRGYHPRLTRTYEYHRRFPETHLLRWKLERELREERYDRAYVFESHSHYRELAARATPEVYAIAEPPPRPEPHYCIRCLEAVEPTLDDPPPRGWLTLPVTEAGRTAAARYLAERGLGDRDVLVGLHPRLRDPAIDLSRGHDRRHRQWPSRSLAELARMLRDHGARNGISIRPVVDLLPEERGRAREFLDQAGDAVTVLVGPPDFERYKAVLERLDLLVTPAQPHHLVGDLVRGRASRAGRPRSAARSFRPPSTVSYEPRTRIDPSSAWRRSRPSACSSNVRPCSARRLRPGEQSRRMSGRAARRKSQVRGWQWARQVL